jgi:hypothetical protein
MGIEWKLPCFFQPLLQLGIATWLSSLKWVESRSDGWHFQAGSWEYWGFSFRILFSFIQTEPRCGSTLASVMHTRRLFFNNNVDQNNPLTIPFASECYMKRNTFLYPLSFWITVWSVLQLQSLLKANCVGWESILDQLLDRWPYFVPHHECMLWIQLVKEIGVIRQE